MSRKQKRNKKSIKHPKYKNYNMTNIAGHQQKGRVLTPPLNALGNQQLLSWIDESLPDFLWAAICASHLERDIYLQIFRDVVQIADEEIENAKDKFITHSALALLEYEEFERLLRPLKNIEQLEQNLSVLLLFDKLPDKDHWSKFLNAEPDNDSWTRLGETIFACYDHQSEKSTDCRWFKLLYLIVVDKIRMPFEMVEPIIRFPHLGDMRSVRPNIRAAEIGTRMPDMMPTDGLEWCAVFWNECLEKTSCNIPVPKQPDLSGKLLTMEDFISIYDDVLVHFHSNVQTTGINARFEGAFGLVMYGIYLVMEITDRDKAYRAQSRIILRSLVETFVLLKFLANKDDPTIWKQYRNYGSGQSKLAFLKLVSMDDIPEYISIEELEMHANADMWMEFQDINLGAWANKNLRKMAEEADVKDIYDRYYDWTSGFVHSNWSAVRDTVFQMCCNPLHRFHRVASIPRMDMNDTLIDAAKLINLMLDELNHLYPSFKPRLKTKQ